MNPQSSANRGMYFCFLQQLILICVISLAFGQAYYQFDARTFHSLPTHYLTPTADTTTYRPNQSDGSTVVNSLDSEMQIFSKLGSNGPLYAVQLTMTGKIRHDENITFSRLEFYFCFDDNSVPSSGVQQMSNCRTLPPVPPCPRGDSISFDVAVTLQELSATDFRSASLIFINNSTPTVEDFRIRLNPISNKSSNPIISGETTTLIQTSERLLSYFLENIRLKYFSSMVEITGFTGYDNTKDTLCQTDRTLLFEGELIPDCRTYFGNFKTALGTYSGESVSTFSANVFVTDRDSSSFPFNPYSTIGRRYGEVFYKEGHFSYEEPYNSDRISYIGHMGNSGDVTITTIRGSRHSRILYSTMSGELVLAVITGPNYHTPGMYLVNISSNVPDIDLFAFLDSHPSYRVVASQEETMLLEPMQVLDFSGSMGFLYITSPASHVVHMVRSANSTYSSFNVKTSPSGPYARDLLIPGDSEQIMNFGISGVRGTCDFEGCQDFIAHALVYSSSLSLIEWTEKGEMEPTATIPFYFPDYENCYRSPLLFENAISVGLLKRLVAGSEVSKHYSTGLIENGCGKEKMKLLSEADKSTVLGALSGYSDDHLAGSIMAHVSADQVIVFFLPAPEFRSISGNTAFPIASFIAVDANFRDTTERSSYLPPEAFMFTNFSFLVLESDTVYNINDSDGPLSMSMRGFSISMDFVEDEKVVNKTFIYQLSEFGPHWNYIAEQMFVSRESEEIRSARTDSFRMQNDSPVFWTLGFRMSVATCKTSGLQAVVIPALSHDIIRFFKLVPRPTTSNPLLNRGDHAIEAFTAEQIVVNGFIPSTKQRGHFSPIVIYRQSNYIGVYGFATKKFLHQGAISFDSEVFWERDSCFAGFGPDVGESFVVGNCIPCPGNWTQKFVLDESIIEYEWSKCTDDQFCPVGNIYALNKADFPVPDSEPSLNLSVLAKGDVSAENIISDTFAAFMTDSALYICVFVLVFGGLGLVNESIRKLLCKADYLTRDKELIDDAAEPSGKRLSRSRDPFVGLFTIIVIYLFICVALWCFFYLTSYDSNEAKIFDSNFKFQKNTDRKCVMVPISGMNPDTVEVMKKTMGYPIIELTFAPEDQCTNVLGTMLSVDTVRFENCQTVDGYDCNLLMQRGLSIYSHEVMKLYSGDKGFDESTTKCFLNLGAVFEIGVEDFYKQLGQTVPTDFSITFTGFPKVNISLNTYTTMYELRVGFFQKNLNQHSSIVLSAHDFNPTAQLIPSDATFAVGLWYQSTREETTSNVYTLPILEKQGSSNTGPPLRDIYSKVDIHVEYHVSNNVVSCSHSPVMTVQGALVTIFISLFSIYELVLILLLVITLGRVALRKLIGSSA